VKPKNNSLLYPFEVKFRKKIVPCLPKYMGTQFLTYCTLLFSIGLFLSYYYSSGNRLFLLLASFFIFLQWLTDILDGEVGRYRNEGLVKWGFLMDHLLDYIFFSAGFLGLMLFVNTHIISMMVIYIVMNMFFIVSFLVFGVTNKFSVSFSIFSTTELRILVIIFNTALFFFDKRLFFNKTSLNIAIVFLFVTLTYYIISSQNKLKKLDLKK